jgi:hypothetical protein
MGRPAWLSFIGLIVWCASVTIVSGSVVGSDAFCYPNGVINGRNGVGGWKRSGSVTAWSGETGLPSVSTNVLPVAAPRGVIASPINAVFLENYWNQGAVKREARWFDNFIISTQPVGPVTALKPPTVFRTESTGSPGWEVEVATDPNAGDIVWKSRPAEASAVSVTVDGTHGAFTGSCEGRQALNAGATHWVRIRAVGQPDWSPWHMPFR